MMGTFHPVTFLGEIQHYMMGPPPIPAKPWGPEALPILAKPVPEFCTGKSELATFAAGCFWGVELSFQRVPGVTSTR